ncbi:MAG TPA: alternative ribosome rescue aminoacyl-tRNA hydrolase ArfB, partial [Candidatus Kapabacteria bacterium]|nr:alternative ribosome rescue aminoacyl-tRNA hydrolase ArfB [Candidatus Kapabacteria bacterium]
GQHVNKTETRVELLFDVAHSPSLSEHQRVKIFHALANRIDGDGVLHLNASQERSQIRNKQIVIQRFVELVSRALLPRKSRTPTRPTTSSREKRIQSKKIIGKKKKQRRISPED